MFRKHLAAAVVSLVMTLGTGGAFAKPAASESAAGARQPANAGHALSVLHAVGQWSVELSSMAEQKASSQLVKDYAREISTTNASKDEKLMSLARSHGIEVAPLDPQTEEGKSLLQRIKGETELLKSLDGDAFDKEYMTLVTNTQQSVIHFLKANIAAAKDQDVKQYLGQVASLVQTRLSRAQDIMAKIYGDGI